MTTLGQLIIDRMTIPGHELSLDEVVEKARKAGEKLGRSNLHKLTKEPPLSLTRATIYGLARGLDVTPLTVANAALESMGIATHPAEVTDTLSTVAIDPTLSDRNRRQLSALIREMRNDVEAEQEPRAQGEADEGEKTSVESQLADDQPICFDAESHVGRLAVDVLIEASDLADSAAEMLRSLASLNRESLPREIADIAQAMVGTINGVRHLHASIQFETGPDEGPSIESDAYRTASKRIAAAAAAASLGSYLSAIATAELTLDDSDVIDVVNASAPIHDRYQALLDHPFFLEIGHGPVAEALADEVGRFLKTADRALSSVVTGSTQAEHDLAARTVPGRSKGEQLREALDRDAEAGDPEGPEGGA
ncbi:hypothetical protein [Gordonia sp. NB41Y]|uniref:hypothetical protein n=1 Tax=Gordonia sp. NB41Y TaxID=875808 RepID=UPI0006B1C8D7|nr:hypothetical protein [Gordonia sp. NB41Y]EMP10031.2 hypothetical protein ISGA_1470 [Gordonia sp. NB41Y]WLP90220.1 hypothetical protein Q9K23_22345 [Gordonia sp. NB41Y]